MATIVTRAGKGSPLTNNELDLNFTNLNTELGSKLVSADLAPYLTSVNAAATYQPISGMSSYLTTAAAAAGYLPLSGGTLTGNLTIASGGASITGNTSVVGTLGVSAETSVAGALVSTSANLAHQANAVKLSYEGSSLSQLSAYGANTTTQGSISVVAKSSNGSLSTVVGTFSSTGLAVTGSVSATGASSNNQLILERTGGATGKWGIYTHSNSLFFSDNVASDERMVIDASGNLLVGTTSGDGASRLQLARSGECRIKLQNTATPATLQVGADGYGGFAYVNEALAYTVYTNGNPRTSVDASGNLTPGANGTQAFGSTSLRWSQVWCTAGAFNTSDATLKTPIRTMQAKELAAGYQMAQELGTFQWIESVKEKGDKARRHVGLTVQRAAEIMESHGLKPWSYGFMGYDKWAAVTEIVDATEEDEGAYQEKVTRQKTVKQTSQNQTVEVINGKPTLKIETVESDLPVTEQIQVVDADGKLVFTTVAEVPAVFDDEGNEVSPAVPAHQVPMLHAVPVMETVTVWKRVKDVRPAGESYAFRSDQLAFFIAAGVAAKVGA